MGGSRWPAEAVKPNEQPTERKKGFGDWMNLIKPANEEKDHWVKIRCNLFGFSLSEIGSFVFLKKYFPIIFW